ncbi:MAG: hypothetical protein OHK0039_27970 [Bacteroidia bacterium]
MPTDRHFWHTLETRASSEAIWRLWTDVPNWKTWDSGLSDAKMQVPFGLGARGIIVSLEGRTSAFVVTDCDPGRSYTYQTRLPLGALYVRRSLETAHSGTRFTHEVWFRGVSGPLFARLFGGVFRTMLPKVMEQVRALAEET